jgi:hypothetical protein
LPLAPLFVSFLATHQITKGYRCLGLSTNRVIISCHVVFDETMFPFSLSQRSPSSQDLDFLTDDDAFPISFSYRYIWSCWPPTTTSDACSLPACTYGAVAGTRRLTGDRDPPNFSSPPRTPSLGPLIRRPSFQGPLMRRPPLQHSRRCPLELLFRPPAPVVPPVVAPQSPPITHVYSRRALSLPQPPSTRQGLLLDAPA